MYVQYCTVRCVSLVGARNTTVKQLAPAVRMLLLMPLGCTNDESGVLDADGQLRAKLIVERYDAAKAAGRHCKVLVSGGHDPRFAFTPTNTSHWQYVSDSLIACGLDANAIIRPGIEALHTVDEAIMVHKFLVANLQCADLSERVDELLVLTSDFHAARARHLFGVAIGSHAQCPVQHRVEEHEGCMMGEALKAREEHEAKSLVTLRTAPFGAWADFIAERRLEAANRSKRWSRRMLPSLASTAGDDGSITPPPPPPSPGKAPGAARPVVLE